MSLDTRHVSRTSKAGPSTGLTPEKRRKSMLAPKQERHSRFSVFDKRLGSPQQLISPPPYTTVPSTESNKEQRQDGF